MIENGGVDLGIPELVDKIFSLIPGVDSYLSQYKSALISRIREWLQSITDNFLETIELTLNRYSSAKPDYYGDVTVLRNGTSTYNDLKKSLVALTQQGKIIDLLVLTHGRQGAIAVSNGQAITGDMIRAMKSAAVKSLSIRSVYMMSCYGSSLNPAWVDAGAKVSAGSVKNNYLPEPTTFFFWSRWKAGDNFENAVTAAYRKTIVLLNEVVRLFIRAIPLPGMDALAKKVDVSELDFVTESAPVIQGQRSITVNSDELTFTQSKSSSLVTTVLPLSKLLSLVETRAVAMERTQSRMVSEAGIDLIRKFEGFRPSMYNDSAGHCTIGYGTLIHRGKCNGDPSEKPYAGGINREQATRLLMDRINEFQKTINDSVSVELNQNQYDALVSFAYNVGSSSFRKSTLLNQLNEGKYSNVPTEMQKWVKARVDGKLLELPALVVRRKEEAELFQKPVTSTAESFLSQTFRRDIDYTIPGALSVIVQPSPNTCWAAVTAMLCSWKKKMSMQIQDALASIGTRYRDMFLAGQGLDENTAKDLYRDAGLETIVSFNPTIEGWEGLLRNYGPLYVDVGYATGRTTRAIIITALKGDGTPTNTYITYVDPLVGAVSPMRFSEFLKKYEAESAVEWPFTIVHWPATSEKMMSMAHQASDEDTEVAPFALANGDNAAAKKEFLVKNAKYLLTLVGFFIKHPAKLYLSYHKTHLDVLLKVLVAVRKAEPIDKQVTELERNIKSFEDASTALVQETKRVPQSPWANENPLLLVVLLPLLRKDPEFVKAYNANLDAYENLVQKALDSAEGCVDAGRQIEAVTPEKVKELTDEIEKLNVSGAIGTIVKQSYLKRLQFVELDLVTSVLQSRVATEDRVKYLKKCLEQAKGAERL